MSGYVTVSASTLAIDDVVVEPVSGCISRVRRITTGTAGELLVVLWMLVGRSWVQMTWQPGVMLRRRLRRGEIGEESKRQA